MSDDGHQPPGVLVVCPSGIRGFLEFQQNIASTALQPQRNATDLSFESHLESVVCSKV